MFHPVTKFHGYRFCSFCVILLTEENRFPELCEFREVENKSRFPLCCPYYDESRKSISHEMFWCTDDGRLEWLFNLNVYTLALSLFLNLGGNNQDGLFVCYLYLCNSGFWFLSLFFKFINNCVFKLGTECAWHNYKYHSNQCLFNLY